MTDVVSKQKRSQMMSGIRNKNTKPELIVRKGLHASGFRYRIHTNDLPGKPDLVFRKYNAVIFVHGCFWHGHNCHLFKWPKSRPDWWRTKILGNREKDAENRNALLEMGWRVLEIWECALKGKSRCKSDEVIKNAADWLCSDEATGVIRGRTDL